MCVYIHFVYNNQETEEAGHKHMQRNVKRGYLTFTLWWQTVERTNEGGSEREEDMKQGVERKAPPDLKARETN